MYALAIIRYRRPLEEVLVHYEAHHAYLVSLKARGVLVLSGHHFFPGLEEPWPHRDECLRINCSQSPASVRAGIRLIAEEVRCAYAT